MENSLNRVTVVLNKDGNISSEYQVTDNNGVERTVHSVQLECVTLKQTGFSIKTARRSAFVRLEPEVFKALEPQLKDGEEFPIKGKLYILETLKPFERADGTHKEPKKAGENGDILTKGGKPIYRYTYFTTDMNQDDTFIKSDQELERMHVDTAPVEKEEDDF